MNARQNLFEVLSKHLDGDGWEIDHLVMALEERMREIVRDELKQHEVMVTLDPNAFVKVFAEASIVERSDD